MWDLAPISMNLYIPIFGAQKEFRIDLIPLWVTLLASLMEFWSWDSYKVIYKRLGVFLLVDMSLLEMV